MGKERGVFEAGAILRKGTAGAKALRERMWDVPCCSQGGGSGSRRRRLGRDCTVPVLLCCSARGASFRRKEPVFLVCFLKRVPRWESGEWNILGRKQ